MEDIDTNRTIGSLVHVETVPTIVLDTSTNLPECDNR